MIATKARRSHSEGKFSTVWFNPLHVSIVDVFSYTKDTFTQEKRFHYIVRCDGVFYDLLDKSTFDKFVKEMGDFLHGMRK